MNVTSLTPRPAGVVGSPQLTGCPGVARYGWFDAYPTSRWLPEVPTYPKSSENVFEKLYCKFTFHCCTLGTSRSGPIIRSVSREEGVLKTNPSVVVGNGCRNVDVLLLAPAFCES